jgi:rod shape-determining protein MreD
MKANSLILISLLVSMLMSIVSLPPWMLWLRPEFPLMVLIYWALAVPERCGFLATFMVGIFQDSLTASLLGKHVLAYTAVIAFILFSYQRLRMLGVWQQAWFVLGLLSMAQIILYWVSLVAGYPGGVGWWFMLPALTGALLWPWLMIFLRGVRRKTGVMNKIV